MTFYSDFGMKHFKILDFPKGLECRVATSSAPSEDGGSTDDQQEGARRDLQIRHRGSDLHPCGLACFFPQTISMVGNVFLTHNLPIWAGLEQSGERSDTQLKEMIKLAVS